MLQQNAMLKATNLAVHSTVNLVLNQAPLKLNLDRVEFICNGMDNTQWYVAAIYM